MKSPVSFISKTRTRHRYVLLWYIRVSSTYTRRRLQYLVLIFYCEVYRPTVQPQKIQYAGEQQENAGNWRCITRCGSFTRRYWVAHDILFSRLPPLVSCAAFAREEEEEAERMELNQVLASTMCARQILVHRWLPFEPIRKLRARFFFSNCGHEMSFSV